MSGTPQACGRMDPNDSFMRFAIIGALIVVGVLAIVVSMTS